MFSTDGKKIIFERKIYLIFQHPYIFIYPYTVFFLRLKIMKKFTVNETEAGFKIFPLIEIYSRQLKKKKVISGL